MKRHVHRFLVLTAAWLGLLMGAGCRESLPQGTLVVTEVPPQAGSQTSTNEWDRRYPTGSRIVLLIPPFRAGPVRVLSEGLAAAGGPIVSPDSQKVFFAGRSTVTSDWQIYEGFPGGGRPQAKTAMPGGAISPALLPDGGLVFVSPTVGFNGTNSAKQASALYVQPPVGAPQRLTFGSRNVADPEMMADGRILFVALPPPAAGTAVSGSTLFTINNDGTEVSAFARPEPIGSIIQRPRLLAEGRIAFVVTEAGAASPEGAAKSIRLAQPFHAGSPLFPDARARIRSVASTANGNLLLCARVPANPRSPLALFRVPPGQTTPGAPLLADPAWDIAEAVELAPHRRPMGRLSSVDATKRTGQILCLDANYLAKCTEADKPLPTTVRVRILAETAPGISRALGVVAVQADGSFLAEVPAEVPLGFEALDEQDRVVGRQSPMLWLRPGENRSCIGCPEPPNRSPHNQRPLAVNVPVPRFDLPVGGVATGKAEQ